MASGWVGGWLGGRWEKSCLGCISEIIGCRILILGRGCMCDLNLTFDFDVVTFIFEILSGQYLRNCKV